MGQTPRDAILAKISRDLAVVLPSDEEIVDSDDDDHPGCYDGWASLW